MEFSSTVEPDFFFIQLSETFISNNLVMDEKVEKQGKSILVWFFFLFEYNEFYNELTRQLSLS